MTDALYEIYNREKHGPLLTTEQAIERLAGLHSIIRAEQSMADYRSYGGGPPFIKQGHRAVRYPQHLLDQWANAQNAKPIYPSVPIAPSIVREHLKKGATNQQSTAA